MTASNLFLEDKILKISREKPWARLFAARQVAKL